MPTAIADAKRVLTDPLYLNVLARFEEVFPDAREVDFARAPGRVNVIGEHTDYNGLPVMPMAIDREIVIAFAPQSTPSVDLVNVDPSYRRVSFLLSGEIEPYEPGHWGNYAKAAAQAVWEWAAEHSPSALPLGGVRGVVGGSIPAGSGLSSSSALVVATGCVMSRDLSISKPELADLLAHGERYVGTQGGGMDQAASLLGQAGYALKIDFAPLATRPVKLPAGHSVVVANTMVTASKAGGARIVYNTRVAECRLALEMLKHDAAEAHPSVCEASLLKHFVHAVPEWAEYVLRLPEDPVSVADVARYVGRPADEVAGRCLVQRDGTLLPESPDGLNPKKRCRHVLSEGARVERAVEVAEAGDAEALGKLMDESHASCAEDYEISCPELDRMVAIMRAHGALGARLTGAGFGGCAVALVPTPGAEGAMDGIWRDYYEVYLAEQGIPTPPVRDSVLFACSPSDGAGQLRLVP